MVEKRIEKTNGMRVELLSLFINARIQRCLVQVATIIRSGWSSQFITR